MLGRTRRTMDIDFSLSFSEQTRSLRELMQSIADELGLELEVITLEEFVPVPANASHRHHFVGQFGFIEVYVYDPYTIALSKLARGFETDIQDILFLLDKGLSTWMNWHPLWMLRFLWHGSMMLIPQTCGNI